MILVILVILVSLSLRGLWISLLVSVGLFGPQWHDAGNRSQVQVSGTAQPGWIGRRRPYVDPSTPEGLPFSDSLSNLPHVEVANLGCVCNPANQNF